MIRLTSWDIFCHPRFLSEPIYQTHGHQLLRKTNQSVSSWLVPHQPRGQIIGRPDRSLGMTIFEISRGHEILLPNPNFIHYFVEGNPSKNYTIYIHRFAAEIWKTPIMGLKWSQFNDLWFLDHHQGSTPTAATPKAACAKLKVVSLLETMKSPVCKQNKDLYI